MLWSKEVKICSDIGQKLFLISSTLFSLGGDDTGVSKIISLNSLPPTHNRLRIKNVVIISQLEFKQFWQWQEIITLHGDKLYILNQSLILFPVWYWQFSLLIRFPINYTALFNGCVFLTNLKCEHGSYRQVWHKARPFNLCRPPVPYESHIIYDHHRSTSDLRSLSYKLSQEQSFFPLLSRESIS